MPDLRILDHGSIVQFVPETERGREWLATELVSEPWQWLGSTLAVDHRYARDVANGAAQSGLEVKLG